MVTFGELDARRVARISRLTEVPKSYGESDLPGLDFADNKALQEDLDNQFFSRQTESKAHEID